LTSKEQIWSSVLQTASTSVFIKLILSITSWDKYILLRYVQPSWQKCGRTRRTYFHNHCTWIEPALDVLSGLVYPVGDEPDCKIWCYPLATSIKYGM
jgi:hypothetical protein